jgi:starch synthase (maltosyl-transferring)
MQQVRIVIENVTPRVDCGRFAAKAVVGDQVEVAVDIWKDGHDLLKAAVRWRRLSPGGAGDGRRVQRSLVRNHRPT